jgi:hypothetical protein
MVRVLEMVTALALKPARATMSPTASWETSIRFRTRKQTAQ